MCAFLPLLLQKACWLFTTFAVSYMKQTNKHIELNLSLKPNKCIKVSIYLGLLAAWQNNDVELPSRNVRISAFSLAKGLLAIYNFCSLLYETNKQKNNHIEFNLSLKPNRCIKVSIYLGLLSLSKQ